MELINYGRNSGENFKISKEMLDKLKNKVLGESQVEKFDWKMLSGPWDQDSLTITRIINTAFYCLFIPVFWTKER